ncbi:hypothetical protein CU110_00045 [Cobetia sp. ICG0124]|nr:hypothetical protein CU110_00045 [Cobetia sp. ICG0124]
MHWAMTASDRKEATFGSPFFMPTDAFAGLFSATGPWVNLVTGSSGFSCYDGAIIFRGFRYEDPLSTGVHR